MGEMADYTLYFMSEDDVLHDYSGILSCNYCRRDGFHWDQTEEGKWRLFTFTGRLHSCKDYRRRDVTGKESK